MYTTNVSEIGSTQQAQKPTRTRKNNNTQVSIFENNKSKVPVNKNSVGDDIARYALEFLGYNESDKSADIFLNSAYSSSTTPWCAAFVEYIMDNFGQEQSVQDWYNNLHDGSGGKWYCPSIYEAAKNDNKIVDINQAEMGDIVLFDKSNPDSGQKIDGVQDHVGIIYSIEGDIVYTIEGNKNNEVEFGCYNINDESQKLTFCKVV